MAVTGSGNSQMTTPVTPTGGGGGSVPPIGSMTAAAIAAANCCCSSVPCNDADPPVCCGCCPGHTLPPLRIYYGTEVEPVDGSLVIINPIIFDADPVLTCDSGTGTTYTYTFNMASAVLISGYNVGSVKIHNIADPTIIGPPVDFSVCFGYEPCAAFIEMIDLAMAYSGGSFPTQPIPDPSWIPTDNFLCQPCGQTNDPRQPFSCDAYHYFIESLNGGGNSGFFCDAWTAPGRTEGDLIYTLLFILKNDPAASVAPASIIDGYMLLVNRV